MMGSVVAGFCMKCGAITSTVGSGSAPERLLCNKCENFYRNDLRNQVLAEQETALASAEKEYKAAREAEASKKTVDAPSFVIGCTDTIELRAKPEEIYEVSMGLDVKYGNVLTINGKRFELTEGIASWLREVIR